MELVDRALIARVIEREMSRHPAINAKKARLAHRADIGRSTLDSALDPTKWGKTTMPTYNAIGNALGLPPLAMSNIGKHNWANLEDDGIDAGLLAWMRREVAKQGMGNPDTSLPAAL